MPVQNPSTPAQGRDGHQAEDPVVKPGGLICVLNKPVLSEIEPVIMQGALRWTPSELVSAEPFVGDGSPAKVEHGKSLPLKVANRLPHHEIVAAEAQIVFVRSAKLVVRLPTLM